MDVRDYRDLGAIIPSFLDDFGLTPAQFRIYGRIARRVGKGGYCSESAQNMAKHCRMNLKTVRSAIQFLEDHRLILIERRAGKSPHIALTHSNEWIPVDDQPQPKTGIPKTDPTQNESGGLPKMSQGGDPKTGRVSTQNEITKGSLEGIPLKNPTKEKSEDQILTPTPPTRVSMTANQGNRDPDGLPSSMAAKEIVGEGNWEAFIKSLVEESRTWSSYEVCNSDQARAAKIKRQYLPKQFENGNLEQRCYLFLDNQSVSDGQGGQEAASKSIDYLAEVNEAIAVYSRRNQAEILRLAPEIKNAIRAAGGVAAFQNANEWQFHNQLLPEYKKCRA